MARDVRLIRSPVSVAGMVLTTISAVVFIIVFLADLFGLHTNPYIGIVFFIALPVLFLIGLVLIPLGAWLERRRRARGQAATELRWPLLDLNNPRHRSTAILIFTLTMVNIVIVSLAAYRGVEYMDSVQFCGSVCHAMQPEQASYQDAPHAKVACVACHIGPGAASFVEAKVNGIRQVTGVLLDNHPRPIPPPVRTMRPARETCEVCHWSEQVHPDKVHRIVEYANDEANTESVTTVRVKVGGGTAGRGEASGIHWHMNIANVVEFVATDDDRQTIPYVKVTDAQGNVREYQTDGTTAEQIAAGNRRRMDCMDCHNRPAHTMSATPERAVDSAIARGEIPTTLPFVRREAVAALKQAGGADPPSGGASSGESAAGNGATSASEATNATMAPGTQQAGTEAIGQSMREFYRTQRPDVFESRRADVERAIAATVGIYGRNVFPEMKVTFGTYPNNIGHIDAPGCFRCHDDDHKTRDGRALGQDCETCHTIE